MIRKELELEVELLKQKVKTLELELELHKSKNHDKEYIPYWPYTYPVWIDYSRRRNDWYNPMRITCTTDSTSNISNN